MLIDNPNIVKINNLATNGFVKTSGGNGTLSVDNSVYATTADASGYVPYVGASGNIDLGVYYYTMQGTAGKYGRMYMSGTQMYLDVLNTALGVNGRQGIQIGFDASNQVLWRAYCNDTSVPRNLIIEPSYGGVGQSAPHITVQGSLGGYNGTSYNDSGDITIRTQTGTGSDSLSGGNVNILSANAIGANKNGGNIIAQAGASTGSGASGVIELRSVIQTYGRRMSKKIVTNDYNVGLTDEVVIASGVSILITLPQASGTGQVFNFLSIASGVVTISGYMTDLIDSQRTQELEEYMAMEVIDYAPSQWGILHD